MSVPVSASNALARNLNVVKMYFKKPTALLISILSLLTLILNFLFNSKSAKPMVSGINSFLSSNQIAYEMSSPNMVLTFLISGICAACFFMIYFSSAAPSGNPSIFFTVLHVISVIELIGLAIIALMTTIFGLVAILSVNTVITFLGNNVEGMENLNVEEISRNIAAYKTSMFLSLGVWVALCAFFLVYVNAQTAFLKSCKRSCKEPSLFSKGANTFGNFSMIFALIQLVFVVVAYLSFNSTDSSTDSASISIDFSSFTTIMLAYTLCNAIALFLKGSLAKNWVAFAKENEVYVPAAAASRSPEANPIATYKATTRRSNDAIKQSQPYLYGEEENKDPNKKSSYIPEELQNDYPEPYDQQPQGGMMNDPFMSGDPFSGDPFGQDPFAQSPMGNPYGQPPMGSPYGRPPMNPNGGNPYNNGMM